MSQQNTTLFDLNKTASAAAITALGQDALSVESIKLEAFTAAAHSRADFSQWESYFTSHLKNYTQQQATPSPAAKAAQTPTPVAAAKISVTGNANQTQAGILASRTTTQS